MSTASHRTNPSAYPSREAQTSGDTNPLQLFIRPEHTQTPTSLRDTEVSPEAFRLRLAPDSYYVQISFPVGNLRIELPCSEERLDQGASRIVAASAKLHPYQSAVVRQQMSSRGQTALEKLCEAVEVTLIYSDVTNSGDEKLRRQTMVLGTPLFTDDHPSYGMRIGPTSLKFVLFDGESSRRRAA